MRFKNLMTDQEGATAIEYGLIAALIAIAAITAMSAVGGSVKSTFNKVNTALVSANSAGN